MNIILFLTIMILFLIFVYQLIRYNNYRKQQNIEYFKALINEYWTNDKPKKGNSFKKYSENTNKNKNLKTITFKEKKDIYPLVRKEISIENFEKIVNNLKEMYRFSERKYSKDTGNDNTIMLEKLNDTSNMLRSREGYRFVKKWILEELSKQASLDDYRIMLVDPTRFNFKYDKISCYYIDYKNNLEKIRFEGNVYRENKEHNFYMFFDIIFDTKFINYYIEDIYIIRQENEEKIIFGDILMDQKDEDDYGVHLSLSNANQGYVTDNYINNYWNTVTDFSNNDKQERKKEERNIYQKGTCFYKEAIDKDNCISYTAREGTGIWDTPCKYDEECPFFKKNFNYPNRRGGCKNGFCEMPVNLKLLAYKEYDENSIDKAICYNCKKVGSTENCEGVECSQCCEDQKDPDLYPNLNSPDYAFTNDHQDRIDHREVLEEKGLVPISIRI